MSGLASAVSACYLARSRAGEHTSRHSTGVSILVRLGSLSGADTPPRRPHADGEEAGISCHSRVRSRHLLVKRVLLWILLVLSATGLPMTLFVALLAFNAVGMGRVFLTTFTVRNHSSEVIYVTPIGTIGKEGLRGRLPVSQSEDYSIPGGESAELRLSPNSERRVTYDSDDIQFSEIAVRGEQGGWRQLVVDPNPTERQYRPPAQKLFVIPPLADLPDASAAVQSVAVAAPRGRMSPWLIGALVVLPPLGLSFSLRQLRALRLHARGARFRTQEVAR